MEPGTDDLVGAPLRVLVVDDSAVAREVMRAVLARDATIQVTTAASGVLALERVRAAHFDVMVLDLEMPGMHGLEVLRRTMAETPLPVVVCTGRAEPGAEAVLEALALGAVEVVYKPLLGVRALLEDGERSVLVAVRTAAVSRVQRPRTFRVPAHPRLPYVVRAPEHDDAAAVVAIGASTGGTEAVRALLAELPPDLPATVVIVQHMPEPFVAPFAMQLDRTSTLRVRVARPGERLEAGRAYLAPGNAHLEVVGIGRGYAARVVDRPPVSGHRPSVDVLFRSTARAAAGRGVGVLLTGMGDDGARGLLEMRHAGAHTIAQDEASCVVYGMPRAAVVLGAAMATLPLTDIAQAVARRARLLAR